jgi:hypothetical protein
MAAMLEIILSQKTSFSGYDSKTFRDPSGLLLIDCKCADIRATRLIGHIA